MSFRWNFVHRADIGPTYVCYLGSVTAGGRKCPTSRLRLQLLPACTRLISPNACTQPQPMSNTPNGANMWDGNGSNFLQGNTAPRSGQVYTMYHGTSMEAAKKIKKDGFRQSDNGMLGRGVYLSRDLEKACRYPLNLSAYQRVVLKVKVNVGKVKKIDLQGHPLQDTWHKQGYDTAWCPPKCGMVPSGLEEDCVWDPQRIQIIEMMYPFLEVVLPCLFFLLLILIEILT